MRLVRRLLGIGLVLLLVLVVAIGGVLAVIFGRAMPQTSGTLAVAGLAARVTVHRDATGIPQIVADSADDLFFAQGFVHASERMWQMEVWRRIGAGRLSELFGASTLDNDKAIRTMGWRQAGEADYAAASPRTRRALEQYAAGVNAWLAQNRGRMGFPFVVAGALSGKGGFGGYDPEPWTPVDSTTFAKLQAWGLAGNLDTEVFKTALDTWFGGNTALTDLLTPDYPAGKPVIAPTAALANTPPATAWQAATRTTGAPAPADTTPSSIDALSQFARAIDSTASIAGLGSGGATIGSSGIGSNNWVVSAGRSATGRALIANDPHLPLSMPSVWFMNGLRCRTVTAACPFDVVGVSFAGTPAVILGHNARIAWGVTNVGPDVQDLFVETADPADPASYVHGGATRPFETRTETIAVKGADPVTITVRSTVHGPVVSDVFGSLTDSGRVYAMRWTALTQPDGLLDSFIGINAAGSFAEFRDALRSYGAPSQNFVYADIEGNIGYQMPGFIPIRPNGNRGDRPVDGASGANDWQGFIAFDELPSLYNPPEGYIVTANNQVTDSAYPYLLGTNWDPGWRAARIRQLLDAAVARGGVTQADLAAIQNDTHPLRAEETAPDFLAVEPKTAAGLAAQNAIRAWDGDCSVGSAGCAAFEVTEWRLQRALFEPWVAGQASAYIGSDFAAVALRVALADPASPLWDSRSTPEVEKRDAVVAAALDAAGADLVAALGRPADWSWGRIHTATFQEQTLGTSGIAPIEAILNKGPLAVGGTSDAVSNVTYTPDDFYTDTTALYQSGLVTPATATLAELRRVFDTGTIPSYRFTMDLGAMDAGTIVQATGQSGNPFDRHYGDLVDDWAAGRSVPLPFSGTAVEESAASTLVLVP